MSFRLVGTFGGGVPLRVCQGFRRMALMIVTVLLTECAESTDGGQTCPGVSSPYFS
jgi:hypothetical protein